ncbi:ribosome-inactivating family protein [Streptomyces bicolor]|uniref:ribosome-inactivating family protein n=1 Tax=Streptomyces bicolor TaxID=66874 RepID=UPI0004E1802E|nr:ribosome-inactivating family protein [Streptomyces bicolor]
MPTSVLIAVALSVLLGILVFFTVPKDTETSPAETAAGKEHVDFPQVRWNINRGSGAYLTMLDQLRNLAETSSNGVAVTGNTESQSFADIVISSGNHTPAVHAIVRLSDFCVVRFSSSDTPHDFVLNLASDVPNHEDADDDWFLGKEGYDALARVANQSLTAVNLSEFSLENSLRDLGIRGTDRTAQARGMLRYIIAITEASRFRPIADRIANGMDNGSNVFVTAQEVGLLRN